MTGIKESLGLADETTFFVKPKRLEPLKPGEIEIDDGPKFRPERCLDSKGVEAWVIGEY